jgi:hypothetical protein
MTVEQQEMETTTNGAGTYLANLPTNVVQAITRVMGQLPAIGKDGKADPSQGGYSYRGIEQITREAQRLFAKYGVVFAPRVLSWEVIDIVVNNKPWTDTRLMVEYDVFGPSHGEYTEDGPVVDKITVGPLLAIGRDNSDKGANKCMTQAFKYALLQVLCISDAKDDADGQSHEADGGYYSHAPQPEPASQEWIDSVKRRIESLPEEHKAQLRQEWKEKKLNAPDYLTKPEFPIADAMIQVHVVQVNQEAQPATSAVDSAMNLDSDPDRVEALGVLNELVEGVPNEGTYGRDVLVSNLRGRFGPAESMTMGQINHAIDIATAWPEPPPAHQPAHTAAGDSLPPPAAQPPADGFTEAERATLAAAPPQVLDDTLAEVQAMSGNDIKGELRARGLSPTGNRDTTGRRLTVALVAEATRQGASQ